MSNRIKPPKQNLPLDYADVITFGKYKGYTVAQVLDPEFVNDAPYLVWAHNDLDFVPWFNLSDEVYRVANKAAIRIAMEKQEESPIQPPSEWNPDYDPFEGVFGPDPGDGYDECK